MLVYANHLTLTGAPSSEAAFKAIGAWLKEQLGYGLRPEQLKQPGEFSGAKGTAESWLRIDATSDPEPALYSWTLKHGDATVRGRQWIIEIGLKAYGGEIDLSCVIRTDEQSALVAEPVTPARPRVIGYLINNVRSTEGAAFLESVPGLAAKAIGQDIDSYRSFLSDIERPTRDYPLVVVSPTREGHFLVDVSALQAQLIGLAQVVEVLPGSNSYDMEETIGRRWSAWDGAVNLINAPRGNRSAFARVFLSSEIASWGEDPRVRLAQLMAWVTNSTNITHLREQVRPEGVRQLALRRRFEESRAKSAAMDKPELRRELDRAWEYAEEMAADNTKLRGEKQELQLEILALQEAQQTEEQRMTRKDYEISALKDQLAQAGGGRLSTYDVSTITTLACRQDQPSPEECLDVLEELHSASCIILDSARVSARQCETFQSGRRLLDLLIRLVTNYRTALIEGGDADARKSFSTGEFAANESETVLNNQTLRRARMFPYRGEQVEMLRHLKIGVADDVGKTIRVHFYWDSDRQLIVIGYCGPHLPILGR
jgi:hypothetical protein